MTADVDPAGSTDPKTLIRNLYQGRPSVVRASMLEIATRREEMTPHLLATIERAIANVEYPDMLYDGTVLAMYLLAEFREPAAFDPILRLLEAANDRSHDIFGDALFENLPAIIASVTNDFAPMEKIVRNERLHYEVRATAFSSIRVAVANRLMPRDEAVTILRDVLRSELSRGDDADAAMVELLAMDALDLGPHEVEAELRQAWDEGLIDHQMVELEELEKTLRSSVEKTMERLRHDKHNELIDDAVAACSWWSLFHDPYELDDDYGVPETVRYESPRPGRNDRCPCGSGKKYKKCCGG